MKIWFDKEKTDFTKFKSEKFLLSPFFEENIIQQDNEFKYSKTWVNDISDIVEFAEIEHADVLVYHDKLDANIIDYINLAKKYNKEILAFYNDDHDAPTILPECIRLYRTSFYKSKRKINEFALPAWSDDFGKFGITLRNKSIQPTVGFCGALTHPLRSKAIDILTDDVDIKANILLRNSFWGGSVHDKQIRSEYIQNTNNSDLILCCRGAGNFSYRLYETISLGRVPIILNTDMVLPCEDVIDWKTLSIWVDDVANISSCISNFWNTITDIDYRNLQLKIRDTYVKYICPSGFASYLNNKTYK